LFGLINKVLELPDAQLLGRQSPVERAGRRIAIPRVLCHGRGTFGQYTQLEVFRHSKFAFAAL
jgi:hypothetical protein